ncbi:Alpha/Beta hydrolase protein [Talaromyces proteolyticus]|uniref:Alpha/Beta hydrolase protein n=1 Tax=Talaromyces proteolyticus TaxID=1131652 RepID=A0AAD4Q4Q8_9EURO|nr:Alpha/Beta hydrolase protein [Talaromyces proteolyticus]KAH8703521.1 Alpha/Beta hydrolase protein [Talaromyces proteolyticus]
MAQPLDVEFNTIDGVTLRGCLYPANQRGPGVVMTSGLICVKEAFGLPKVARDFQKAGITALIYDTRTVGQSGGHPRNDIDPYKQIEDCSDALTFLANHPTVDPSQVGLWGVSLGGAVSLCCASLDPRIRFVISACPILKCEQRKERLPQLLAKAVQDREAQIKGNPPFYHLAFAERRGTIGSSPFLGAHHAGLKDLSIKDPLNPTSEHKLNHEVSFLPNPPNAATIQTTYRFLMWNPFPILEHLHSTPVLFIIPEEDEFIPPNVQLKYFDDLQGPKRLHLEKGSIHTNIFDREGNQEILNKQVEFVRDALNGCVGSKDPKY